MNNKPWETEPSELKWVDAATGLTCLILRAPDMGHLCGYVRIPRRHNLYRNDRCSDPKTQRIQVHGGVTFKGEMHRKTGGVRRGRWIGFDCAHARDLVPGLLQHGNISAENPYRDIAYVTSQVEKMAKQLKSMGA